MKKTRSRLFYALAVLLGALFVLACLAGFAACGNSDEPEDDGGGNGGGGNGQTTTYTFEAEDAVLWAEEAQLWGECENEITYGTYLTGMGVIFGVQTVYGASGDAAVGYVAHNSPTATFKINSSKAVSGVKLTLTAASLDIGVSASSWGGAFALATGWINDYSGSDHKILSVNGTSVALSGKLDGYGSLFNGAGTFDEEGNVVEDEWTDSENALAVDHFGTLTATIDLKEGDNEIVLTHDGAGVSWDCIEIETDATLTMTKTDNTGFDSNKGTYVPNTSGGTGDDDDEEEEETFSRFVTGPYVENTSVDAYYLYPNPDDPTVTAMFTGSEVTSVTYAASADPDDDLTGTYTINGKSAVMDDDQVKAFWGDGYEDYIGDEYLTVTLLANAGETVTVYTDKSPNGITLNGDSNTLDDTFFTRVQDVTTRVEGKQLYTFAIGDDKYEVVLGEVKSSDGSLTLEAEDAGLFNSSSSTASSVSQIGTEQTKMSDNSYITNVKNFNEPGDKIVFQVLSDCSVPVVNIEITAASAGFAIGTYTFTDNNEILTVNGGSPIELSGALSNGMFVYNNYGTLTGTISLQQGINYIVLTAGSSASSAGYLNVDKIDLTWEEQEVTVTSSNIFGGTTTTTETAVASLTEVATGGKISTITTTDEDEPSNNMTSLTLGSDSAAMFNATGKEDSTLGNLLGTETLSDRSGVDESGNALTFDDGPSIKNFNTAGDKVAFEILADAAIDSVTVTITAGAAELGSGLKVVDYDASSHVNVLSVNGTDVAMSGKITASTEVLDYNGSWGTITATISLQAGINYIVFTCDGTGLNLGDITLSWTTT